ncbi:MAG: methylisocitrate lyase [Trueperaceae bacterium]|nr:methylisocitrate lyase [Trueperaceae bacterium]
MLFVRRDDVAIRRALRERLAAGETLRFPGAFSPLVARSVADIGFDGVYVSGAVTANDLGYPDVGLTTLSEVADRAGRIARATALPTLVDADTGFGEPLSVARSVQEFEDRGLAGLHLEDQVNPKRCGHLDGKALVSTGDMVRKLAAAVAARRDPDFLIVARTDARSVEGLGSAIERAQAYVAAGADVVFCEALERLEEYAAFRDAIAVPLIANMTEFGKTPLFHVSELAAVGVGIVIYPVTTLRVAMGAVERSLRALRDEGHQRSAIEGMQTRSRLYELVEYDAYGELDASVAQHGYDESS